MFVHSDDEGIRLRIDEGAIGLGCIDQHDLLVGVASQTGQTLGRTVFCFQPSKSRYNGPDGPQIRHIFIQRQLAVDLNHMRKNSGTFATDLNT